MLNKRTVYLVGAGPGDPGLITRRGLEVLCAADVIVYDRLVSSELLLEARPDAKLISVGKSGSHHALEQEEINQLLGDEATEGHSVCRLKGGDPFLFGRGGEEADHLRKRGIPFEVVPGVTSAIAVPAYAGIPVTDRRVASTLAIATGHEDAEKQTNTINWAGLSRSADTLVVLMGVKNLKVITNELLASGRPGSTPVALIRWGTTGCQEMLVSELSKIVQEVKNRGFSPPAIFVVGEVVAFSSRLSWFEKRPLRGLRILVTRPRRQASALSSLLRQAGAEPVVASLIRVEPVSVGRDRLKELFSQQWDWIVFTSANGVAMLGEQMRDTGFDWRALGKARLAAMGPGTAAALEGVGLRVDFTPTRAVAESLAEELPAIPSGARVLLPRAAEARGVLPDLLTARGAVVESVITYRTVPDEVGVALLRSALEENKLDFVTLTSSSGVHALIKAIRKDALRQLPMACIGPITAETAVRYGLEVVVEAREHTIPGLVSALVAYVVSRGDRGCK